MAGRQVASQPLPAQAMHKASGQISFKQHVIHRSGPQRLCVLEEVQQQLAGAVVGVQLADARNQDGPVDTSQVAADVGVDAAALRPQLDGAQGGPVAARGQRMSIAWPLGSRAAGQYERVLLQED